MSECGGPGTSGKEDEEEDKELARRYPESGFPRIRVADHLGIILRRIRRFTLQDQRTFDLSVVILSTMIFPCTNYSSNYA